MLLSNVRDVNRGLSPVSETGFRPQLVLLPLTELRERRTAHNLDYFLLMQPLGRRSPHTEDRALICHCSRRHASESGDGTSSSTLQHPPQSG